MRIRFSLFPHGRTRALTFSYDDGTVHDRRLVEMFDRVITSYSIHYTKLYDGSDGPYGRQLHDSRIGRKFRRSAPSPADRANPN